MNIEIDTYAGNMPYLLFSEYADRAEKDVWNRAIAGDGAEYPE